jgi:hypothetical protein
VQSGGTLQLDGKPTTPDYLLPLLACLEGQWLGLVLDSLSNIIYEIDFRTIPTAYIPDDEGYLPTVNFTIHNDCDVRIDTTWPE